MLLDTSVLSAVLRRSRKGERELGVALSTPDALIAAQALNRRARLFSSNGDFDELAGLAGLKLVAVAR